MLSKEQTKFSKNALSPSKDSCSNVLNTSCQAPPIVGSTASVLLQCHQIEDDRSEKTDNPVAPMRMEEVASNKTLLFRDIDVFS